MPPSETVVAPFALALAYAVSMLLTWKPRIVGVDVLEFERWRSLTFVRGKSEQLDTQIVVGLTPLLRRIHQSADTCYTYSEDLNPGQKITGIMIANPFAERSQA